MRKHLEFIAGQDAAGMRLDKWLAQRLTDYSRSYLQKLISNDLVKVNGRIVRASHRLSPGELLEIEIPPPEKSEVVPQNIPVEIVYEDEHLVVVNKPAGLVVHPGAGVRDGTLVNALLYHCQQLSGLGGQLRPGIVHRLDKNTSGLLVVAKTDRAHHQLARQFAEKSASREYLALVWGTPDPLEGTVETRLDRSKRDRTMFTVADRGKIAITAYRVEEVLGFLSLLRVRLKTGRTHQIRIHLNYLHHPVFGDPEYHGRYKQLNRLQQGRERQLAQSLLKILDHQALHAFRLSFRHPESGEIVQFEAPLPADFRKVLEILRENYRE